MRVVFLALTLAALAALGTTPGRAAAPPTAEDWNGAEIDWRTIGSGIREATRTGKPVIMVFHATWCSSCRKYRAVFRDPRIVAASRRYVMILIDADADKMANGAFNTDGTYVPRTMFLDSEGTVRTDLVGRNPSYRHEIDKDAPDELLSLMLKGAPEDAPGAPMPDEKQASQ